ncbi:ABC transporter substrate-binding protein [Promicromonospora thailandica]|uniref:Raffinose/stachyose/melibiose transport system substrate-binding protein n=1 Tax=Promicromonospora thailandica TaxID=765201 RepID=A0A9X2JVY7_9MICO|nr:extracellular solute-binding protein [Promicromonospora thailandica]MCP2264588.1 raffinose/stachyose/melibiose transport system substrate-binding protein [Promicromonospora thailandica]BFF20344.1 extracellular solute-binding protein [Promicromonospora thailandica]
MPARTPSPPKGLSRRSFLGAGLVGAGLALTGCGSLGRPAEVSFYQSKPEVIGYFDELLARFRDERPGVRVSHDVTSDLSAGFARGAPPDLGCSNYNFEIARFVDHGALSDLGDMPEAGRINPDLLPLVELTASYPGRTSVLPYSLMAAGVLYNRATFAEHGLEAPTTWSELVEVCDALTAAGVTPIYGTFAEPWTIGQGILDYTVGGLVDVTAFFEALQEQGADTGPGSPVSFEKDFREPVERMLTLVGYTNADAAGRGYGDGNLAFARGEAAMYLQGPWALTEIAKTSPDLDVGIFPLPMTDDPADRKVRVNVDLALWVPDVSPRQDGARELVSFLMRPEIIDAYNADNLGFGVTTDAPPVTHPALVELQEYYDGARFYLGPSQLVPESIPVHNYAQAIVTGADPGEVLRTLDADWARLARRS